MRPLLAAIALTLGIGCSSAPPLQQTVSGKAMAEALPEREGLEHVARVNANLYRGGQPIEAGGGWAELARMGIKTVINLRRVHDHEEEARAAGLDYYRIPLRADVSSEPPTDEQVKAFFEIVLDPLKQPVFVQCARGKDRTGTMIALYRVEVDGWSNAEAIAEMDAFGYSDYYQDLKRFVADYRARGYAK